MAKSFLQAGDLAGSTIPPPQAFHEQVDTAGYRPRRNGGRIVTERA
ncbi:MULTISPECIES: hypothetical protein [Actibacterium]|uniref:Uncharacterized protein n=1 Tax=Actibacterium naphthalenivorans TaxID=1614693 RepID=A0A840CJG2_9RHOB|nr:MULTISPECIES: hypothetical protein [Actibacterium]MBB4022247.1 hypothetical protein [Actibacterium naphthalenivorans]